MESVEELSDNPFRGPRAYSRGDRLYGRDEDAARVADLLVSERILLLFSSSGAGKTSLIQAKVVPEMESRGFQVLGPVRFSGPPRGVTKESRGESDFIVNTLVELEGAIPTSERFEVAELEAVNLADYLGQRAHIIGDRKPKLLIFDQFEELFAEEWAAAEATDAFFRQLGSALEDRRLWVLAAMREEYLPALEMYADWVPTSFRNRYRLQLLTEQKAIDVISLTTREGGVELDQDTAVSLVKSLRPDLRSSVRPDSKLGLIEPLHLQLVGLRIWEKPRKDAACIGPSEVEPTGDLEQSLSDYYESTFAKLCSNPRTELIVRDWFNDALISPLGKRLPVAEDAASIAAIPKDVIAALEGEYHLLVRHRRVLGSSWYELAHDRLINPVRAANRTWYEQDDYRRLHRRAVEAKSEGFADHTLLLGRPLRDASECLKQARALIALPIDQEYIERCRSKDKVNRWIQLGKISGLTVVVSVAVVFLVLWQVADEARQIADGAATGLQTALEAVAAAASDAQEARQVAEQREHVARALALATLSQRERWVHRNSDTASLLARRAFSLASDVAPELLPTIDSSLRNALSATPFYRSISLEGLDAGSIASARRLTFSPARSQIAVLLKNGQLRLRSVRSLNGEDGTEASFDNTLDVAYRPDGGVVALVGSDSVKLWDEARRTVKGSLSARSNIRGPGRFDDIGRRFAAVLEDGRIALWESDSGRLLAEANSPGPAGQVLRNPHEVALRSRADGTILAAASRNGDMAVWKIGGKGEAELTWHLDYGSRIMDCGSEVLEGVSVPGGELLTIGLGPRGEWAITVSRGDGLGGRAGGYASGIWLWGLKPPCRSNVIVPTEDSIRNLEAQVARGQLVKLVDPQRIGAASCSDMCNRVVVGGDAGIAREWDLEPLWNGLGKTDSPSDIPEVAFRSFPSLMGNLRGVEAQVWDGQTVIFMWDNLGRLRATDTQGIPDATSHIEAHTSGLADLDKKMRADEKYIRVARFQDSGVLLTGGLKTGLVEWNLAEFSKPVKRLWDGTPGVRAIDWDRERTIVGIVYRGKPTRQPVPRGILRDLNRDSCPDVPLRHRDGLWAIDIAPDASVAVTASWDKTAGLWTLDRDENRCLQATGDAAQHDSPVISAVLHPGLLWFATGTLKGDLYVWKLRTDGRGGRYQAELLGSFSAHEGPVHDLDYNQKENLLASAGGDGTIKVWSMGDREDPGGVGRNKLVLTGSSGYVQALRFSRIEPLRLVAGGADGEVRIWQLYHSDDSESLRSHDPIVLSDLNSEILAVDFDPSGRLVAASDGDGHVAVWLADVAELAEAVCRNAWRDLSDEDLRVSPQIGVGAIRNGPTCPPPPASPADRNPGSSLSGAPSE